MQSVLLVEEAGSQEQKSTKVAPKQCQSYLWGDARTSSHTPGAFWRRSTDRGWPRGNRTVPATILYITQWHSDRCHTQNTAGENSVCCSLRAPPTHYKFGSDCPWGDDFKSPVSPSIYCFLLVCSFSPTFLLIVISQSNIFTQQGGGKKKASPD